MIIAAVTHGARIGLLSSSDSLKFMDISITLRELLVICCTSTGRGQDNSVGRKTDLQSIDRGFDAH